MRLYVTATYYSTTVTDAVGKKMPTEKKWRHKELASAPNFTRSQPVVDKALSKLNKQPTQTTNIILS